MTLDSLALGGLMLGRRLAKSQRGVISLTRGNQSCAACLGNWNCVIRVPIFTHDWESSSRSLATPLLRKTLSLWRLSAQIQSLENRFLTSILREILTGFAL